MSQCVSVCTCIWVGGGGANRPHPVTSYVPLSDDCTDKQQTTDTEQVIDLLMNLSAAAQSNFVRWLKTAVTRSRAVEQATW